MQVWDQVKVIAQGHQYEGQAGLIVKADQTNREAVLKLDTVSDPVVISFDGLQFLGR